MKFSSIIMESICCKRNISFSNYNKIMNTYNPPKNPNITYPTPINYTINNNSSPPPYSTVVSHPPPIYVPQYSQPVVIPFDPESNVVKVDDNEIKKEFFSATMM